MTETIEPTQTLIQNLEGRLRDAIAWQTQTRQSLDAALLEHETGTIDGKALTSIRRTFDGADQSVNDLQAMLAGAKRRFDQDAAATAAADVRRRWQEGAALAEKRLAVAEKVEALAGELGARYAELLELTTEMAGVVPAKIDEAVALSSHTEALYAVRECLQLNGALAGMPALPFSEWVLRRRPSLIDRCRGALQYLEGRSHA